MLRDRLMAMKAGLFAAAIAAAVAALIVGFFSYIYHLTVSGAQANDVGNSVTIVKILGALIGILLATAMVGFTAFVVAGIVAAIPLLAIASAGYAALKRHNRRSQNSFVMVGCSLNLLICVMFLWFSGSSVTDAAYLFLVSFPVAVVGTFVFARAIRPLDAARGDVW
jgi:hypothetical protein